MSTFIEEFNYFLNNLVFPFFTTFMNWLTNSLIGKIFLFLLLMSAFTFLIMGFIKRKED